VQLTAVMNKFKGWGFFHSRRCSRQAGSVSLETDLTLCSLGARGTNWDCRPRLHSWTKKARFFGHYWRKLPFNNNLELSPRKIAGHTNSKLRDDLFTILISGGTFKNRETCSILVKLILNIEDFQ
jgi:hypothetical protein